MSEQVAVEDAERVANVAKAVEKAADEADGAEMAQLVEESPQELLLEAEAQSISRALRTSLPSKQSNRRLS